MEDPDTHRWRWQWRSRTHLPLRIIITGLIFWHHWAPNSQGERVGDGARWVGWLEEGWRDRGGGAGLVGLSVEGWWLSVLSRSPEKKRKKRKQQQEARNPQTLLNYRAEAQQREERKDDKKTTKKTKGPAWCHLLNKHPARQTFEKTVCYPGRTETDRRREEKRQERVQGRAAVRTQTHQADIWAPTTFENISRPRLFGTSRAVHVHRGKI